MKKTRVCWKRILGWTIAICPVVLVFVLAFASTVIESGWESALALACEILCAFCISGLFAACILIGAHFIFND